MGQRQVAQELAGTILICHQLVGGVGLATIHGGRPHAWWPRSEGTHTPGGAKTDH